MKTCYFFFACLDNGGEAYGFFELEGVNRLVLVHHFDANDAMYRDEYMHGLFRCYGVDMKRLPAKHEAAAIRILEAAC